MAGSGNWGSGIGSPTHGDHCNDISFKTNISSPNPEVVPLLREGDILKVELCEKEVEKVTYFVALLYKDSIVGSFTERVSKIASCIREGHIFCAEVLSIRGGRIEINVRAS